MNTYTVKYLDGTDLQMAYMQGVNKTEAKKEFSKIYPDIDSGKILSTENIQEQSTDYGASIAVAKIIAFIGWMAVFGGVILVLIAVTEAINSGKISIGTILVILPTAGVSITGLILILAGQASRALLDNANYSKQMLDEMRNRK